MNAVYPKLSIFYFLLLSLIFYSLTDEEVLLLHTKVDLVVTLGGDGTVLWVCLLFLFVFILELDYKGQVDVRYMRKIPDG